MEDLFGHLASALSDEVVFIRLKEDLEIERKVAGAERRFTLPAGLPLPLTLLGAQALTEDSRVFPMPALIQGLIFVLEREEVLDSKLDGLPVYRAFAQTMAEDVVHAAENELKDAVGKQDWAHVRARAVFLLNLAEDADAPHLAPLWLALGWASCRLGDLELGVRWLERSVHLDPKRLDALSELGTALAKLGRLDEAAERLEEARKLQADLPVLFNLVQVSRQLGRKAQAQKYLEEVEKLAPGDERVAKLRASFEADA